MGGDGVGFLAVIGLLRVVVVPTGLPWSGFDFSAAMCVWCVLCGFIFYLPFCFFVFLPAYVVLFL